MASIKEHVAKNGERTWKVLFRLPQPAGPARQASRSFGNEKAAEKFKARIHATSPAEACAWLDGLNADATKQDALTVDQLFELWFDANKGDWIERVRRGYRRDYVNWVQPTFGHLPADMIDEKDVQAWIDDIKSRTKVDRKTGRDIPALSAKSVADRHAILSGMFKWGSSRTRELVRRSPCLETELPKKKKTSVKGMRLQELKWLLAAGEEIGEQDTADFSAFLAGTGWRISEGIALHVGSVEILYASDGTRLVYVSVDRVYRSGQGFVDDAKSNASFQRRLRVIGPGADVVARRIEGKAPADLVFTYVDPRPGKRGGVRAWNPTTYRERRLPLLVEAAGLTERGITPHWLRHTHVAVCIASGMGLAEIQRRLGHEHITTTIGTYGRMFEEMTQEMADRADLLMAPEANPNVLGEVVRGEIQ